MRRVSRRARKGPTSQSAPGHPRPAISLGLVVPVGRVGVRAGRRSGVGVGVGRRRRMVALRDRAETARVAGKSWLAGRLCRWWQVMGSNHRRLSRRFTARSFCRETRPLTSTDNVRGAFSGPLPSAICPWTPNFWAHASTDGHGPAHGRLRTNPRTGPVGAVRPTTNPRFSPLTCHFMRPVQCPRNPGPGRCPMSPMARRDGNGPCLAVSGRCFRGSQPELARSALPCAGSVFLVAQDPGAVEAELARLRAENARLLKLLRLSPQQAAPPVPGQGAVFVAPRVLERGSCTRGRGPAPVRAFSASPSAATHGPTSRTFVRLAARLPPIFVRLPSA
jgi:hypothetical protein